MTFVSPVQRDVFFVLWEHQVTLYVKNAGATYTRYHFDHLRSVWVIHSTKARRNAVDEGVLDPTGAFECCIHELLLHCARAGDDARPPVPSIRRPTPRGPLAANPHDFFIRVLRADEDPTQGLFAKAPQRTYEVCYHVTGTRDTQFVSFMSLMKAGCANLGAAIQKYVTGAKVREAQEAADDMRRRAAMPPQAAHMLPSRRFLIAVIAAR
jgi:hypothetical protein